MGARRHCCRAQGNRRVQDNDSTGDRRAGLGHRHRGRRPGTRPRRRAQKGGRRKPGFGRRVGVLDRARDPGRPGITASVDDEIDAEARQRVDRDGARHQPHRRRKAPALVRLQPCRAPARPWKGRSTPTATPSSDTSTPWPKSTWQPGTRRSASIPYVDIPIRYQEARAGRTVRAARPRVAAHRPVQPHDRAAGRMT